MGSRYSLPQTELQQRLDQDFDVLLRGPVLPAITPPLSPTEQEEAEQAGVRG